MCFQSFETSNSGAWPLWAIRPMRGSVPNLVKTDFCHHPGQLGFPAASGFYFPRAWIAWTHLLLGPLTCFCNKPKLATARPFLPGFQDYLP